MKTPVWIDEPMVMAIHQELLSRFGGLAGIRDAGLLDSALHRPHHLLAYGTPTLFDLAAAYACGIVKNHPFLDGNKRTGFMAAYTFLGLNGQTHQSPEAEVVVMTRGLAAGEIPEAGYAAWLRDSCARRARPSPILGRKNRKGLDR